MVRGAQAQDLFNQIMGRTMTLMIVSKLVKSIDQINSNVFVFRKTWTPMLCSASIQ